VKYDPLFHSGPHCRDRTVKVGHEINIIASCRSDGTASNVFCAINAIRRRDGVYTSTLRGGATRGIYTRDGSPLFRRRHVVIRFLATCPVRPSVRTSPQYRSVIRRTAARVRRSAADDDERGDNAVVVVVINRPQANAPTTEIRKMAATDVYK